MEKLRVHALRQYGAFGAAPGAWTCLGEATNGEGKSWESQNVDAMRMHDIRYIHIYRDICMSYLIHTYIHTFIHSYIILHYIILYYITLHYTKPYPTLPYPTLHACMHA